MRYLLDTNACIVHLRSVGGSAIATRLAALAPGDVAVCAVVVAELTYGALRSQKRGKNLADVEHFVAARCRSTTPRQ